MSSAYFSAAVKTNNMAKTKHQLEAKDVLPNINRTRAAERPKMPLFIPGDFDLDLQTRSSEGPNTCFV